MKKWLIVLLCINLSLNSCLAATKISKKKLPEYKQEVTSVIETIVKDNSYIDGMSINQYIEIIHSRDNAILQDFYKNKNNMYKNKEAITKLKQDNALLNNLISNIYNEFNNIINKYSIEITGNFFECLEQKYLFKYEIPLTKDFSDIIRLTNQFQRQNIDAINEITTYSIEYEQQKIANYKQKYVNNRIVDLDNLLTFNGVQSLKTNTLYTTKAKVFQIINNGVLANTFYGDGTTIFIQTSMISKLKPEDMFTPFIILRHTGKMYTYRSLLGNYNSVPIFTIVNKNEFTKATKLPEIGENFYFIDKPELIIKWSDINLINPNYTFNRPFLK